MSVWGQCIFVLKLLVFYLVFLCNKAFHKSFLLSVVPPNNIAGDNDDDDDDEYGSNSANCVDGDCRQHSK